MRCTEDASLLWDRCAVKKELYELFDFAWPLVATLVMYFLANIVSMAFVGQLGAVDLAAAGQSLIFGGSVGKVQVLFVRRTHARMLRVGCAVLQRDGAGFWATLVYTIVLRVCAY